MDMDINMDMGMNMNMGRRMSSLIILDIGIFSC
jgi:hypothetical protein